MAWIPPAESVLWASEGKFQAEVWETFSQEKIEAIAKETYGAASVEYLPQAEKQIELYTKMGFAGLPICMAKTQYSFSADAAAKVSISCRLFPLTMGWTHLCGPLNWLCRAAHQHCEDPVLFSADAAAELSTSCYAPNSVPCIMQRQCPLSSHGCTCSRQSARRDFTSG